MPFKKWFKYDTSFLWLFSVFFSCVNMIVQIFGRKKIYIHIVNKSHMLQKSINFFVYINDNLTLSMT